MAIFWEKMLGRKDLWQRLLEKFCQLSFEEFGLKQLAIITHLENEASQKVALKVWIPFDSSVLKEVIATQEKCGIILNFGM